MILRLCSQTLLRCRQQHSIRTCTYSTKFRSAIQEQLFKCFKLKKNYKVCLLHTLRLFGLCGGGTLFFVK